jgi:phosphoglycerol geranylgeranyltransferase
MRWRGRVDRYIGERLRQGPLHFTLLDPDEISRPEEIVGTARRMAEAGTDAFLLGGSLGVTEGDLDRVAEALEPLGLPLILFPGNVNGISGRADAILFMSLLNSDDPYYIVGAQVQGAPIVRRHGLEALPTAYLIVGYGGAAGYVGRARPLPLEKPELAAAYTAAAEMMGMRYVYLEAGSGAPRPVSPEVVRAARGAAPRVRLIVGGGIRSPVEARRIIEAGADIVVTGTIVEESPERAAEIIRAVKSGD